MKTELKKVYYCEYCNKHNLSASSVSRHEKYCRFNPINKHKCFEFCKYLEMKQEYVIDEGHRTEFTCTKLNKKLYSYKLEKKSTSYFRTDIKFDGMERMPLECKEYGIKTIDDGWKEFSL